MSDAAALGCGTSALTARAPRPWGGQAIARTEVFPDASTRTATFGWCSRMMARAAPCAAWACLALVALGEVRAIAAGGGAPAPVLPDYTLLLPNLMVLLGSLFALVGAAAALATGCAALLNAARGGRRRASASRRPVRGTGDRNG
jgi:hypothetical protein